MKTIKRHIKYLLVALMLCGGTSVVFADPAEGIGQQSVASSQPQVRVLGNHVEITVPGDEDRTVTIYALTGQVVKTLTAAPGVTTVDLPKGYYIVKCDRVSSRVVIK